MRIGFHTDAFNSSYWSFTKCVEWASAHGIEFIECGVIDGVCWSHALGYYPHISLCEDPREVAAAMRSASVRLSSVDAAFPLSGLAGATHGVAYVERAIRWAYLADCPCVDTTDGQSPVPGLSDGEVLDLMVMCYREIMKTAERYKVCVNVEPHGYYTTRADFVERLLDRVGSPLLGVNLDTGNVFIRGGDPVDFCRRFAGRIGHAHVKDVSPQLAAMARGSLTGIALSQMVVGQGANARNIEAVLDVLARTGYAGVLSVECEGAGGPLLEESLHWVRQRVETVTGRSPRT